MSSYNDKLLGLDNLFQRSFIFSGEVVKAANLAYAEFMRLSKGAWSLESYSICFSVTDDNRYTSLAFMPDPAYEVNGIPFEVADRGMYKNGMGVVYIYRLVDYSLVNTTYMR
ncbi:hypothetical protein ACN9MY_05635 [Pseudoduganella sp. R-31]|uniref:hypothetical protein n=1 Tax=Pseudoduganella sp. R-31 TaxID=3404060 RepID=UPI003CF9C6C8